MNHSVYIVVLEYKHIWTDFLNFNDD